MSTQVFETDGAPTLSLVLCQGDLDIRGWSRPTVRLQGASGKLEASQEAETVMISSPSDLRIEAPYESTLHIQAVHGDARIKRIDGEVAIDSIHGDLVLNRVGPATLQTVYGDVSARTVDGDLQVGAVHGDFSARQIDGDLSVQTVGRDLGLRDLHGSAEADNVHGDIRLRTALFPGRVYRFKAGGDLVARVTSDSHADLTLRSGRDKPRVKAQLSDQKVSEHEISGRLGDGGAEAVLEAGRDLVLSIQDSEQPSDWDELAVGVGSLGAEFGLEFASLAEEITAQIEAQMAGVSAQLEEKLAHLSMIDERTASAAQRVQQQAEQAAERIRRAAEREAQRARRHADRAYRKSTGRIYPAQPSQPASSSEPVSDNERMAILSMVAQSKITIEEAETLLAALNA